MPRRGRSRRSGRRRGAIHAHAMSAHRALRRACQPARDAPVDPDGRAQAQPGCNASRSCRCRLGARRRSRRDASRTRLSGSMRLREPHRHAERPRAARRSDDHGERRGRALPGQLVAGCCDAEAAGSRARGRLCLRAGRRRAHGRPARSRRGRRARPRRRSAGRRRSLRRAGRRRRSSSPCGSVAALAGTGSARHASTARATRLTPAAWAVRLPRGRPPARSPRARCPW